MILFWLAIMLLTVAACIFVLWPLWRPQTLDQDKQRLENKAWYEDQLLALQNALQQKKIDAARFEHDQLALQHDFLTFQNNNTLLKKNMPHRILAIVLACLLSIAAFYLYQKLGASQILIEQFSQQQTRQELDTKIQRMGGSQNVINQLKKRLSDHPQDAQGWYLLGRIYFSQNQFKEARLAFEKAVQLAPNRSDIVVELVEASYLSGDVRTESRLHQALQELPHDPTLLNVAALILYQQKKYQQALAIWQNLLLQIPTHSDAAKALETMIAQARSHISE